MSSLHLRPAELADADALSACIRRAYAPYFETLPDLPDVAAGMDEHIAKDTVIVAERDGILAGVVVLVKGNGFAQIANVAVEPDQSGHGIGRALLFDAQRVAKQYFFKELRLATHVAMESNISLYTHLGWSETGRDGNKVFMSKPI